MKSIKIQGVDGCSLKLLIGVILTLVFLFGSRLAGAERLTVMSDLANIRSGPSTDKDILWKVGKYHPLLVIEKSGPWFHFRDFEGDEGWIHQSLLGKIPALITNMENCNIRAGPGTDFKILFSVEKGIPFKMIKRKGSWFQIEHADGDQGWIHKSLVW